MKLIKNLPFLTAIIAVMLTVSEPAFSNQSVNKLARVMVLNFANEQNNSEIEWLSNSLPNAIQEAMAREFTFQKVVPTKTIDIRKLPEQAYLKKIALDNGADILIVGNYSPDAGNENVTIISRIYNARDDSFVASIKSDAPLNNELFGVVDTVAQRIVGQIYTYALRNREKSNELDSSAGLRLLVLIPSFSNDKERAIALRELEALKQNLSKRYTGRYLTLFEFFDKFGIDPNERSEVTSWAKARDSAKITNWLEDRGIRDAFVVLVEKEKVGIMPIVNGETENKLEYSTNATPAEKAGIMAFLAGESNLTPKSQSSGDDRFSLSLNTFQKQNDSLRIRAGGTFSFALPDLNQFTPLFYGGRLEAEFPGLVPWVNPIAALTFRHGPGKDNNEDMQIGTLSVGVTYPYWSIGNLTLSAGLLGGATLGQVGSNPTFVIPSGELLQIVDYRFSQSWGAFLSFSGTYLFDKDVPGILFNSHLGVSYRF